MKLWADYIPRKLSKSILEYLIISLVSRNLKFQLFYIKVVPVV